MVTVKQIANKIRSLKRQTTRLEKRKKRMAKMSVGKSSKRRRR